MKNREPAVYCITKNHGGKWMALESTIKQGHSLFRRLVTLDKALAERVAGNWQRNDYSIPGSVEHGGHAWALAQTKR